MFCMDDMVPQDYLLRIIDKVIDWNFIYDLVQDKYPHDNMDDQAWIRLCLLKSLLSSIFMVSEVCARQ